jgi:hypothetical protein
MDVEVSSKSNRLLVATDPHPTTGICRKECQRFNANEDTTRLLIPYDRFFSKLRSSSQMFVLRWQNDDRVKEMRWGLQALIDGKIKVVR